MTATSQGSAAEEGAAATTDARTNTASAATALKSVPKSICFSSRKKRPFVDLMAEPAAPSQPFGTGVTPAEAAPPTSTDPTGRRVWDKEFFSKRAQARLFEGDDGPIDEVDLLKGVPLSSSREAKRASKSAAADVILPRRPLQQRTAVLPLDQELGKTKVVTAHTPKQQQGGYWCETCECLIKDSQAYLDHVNGKRHNRLLGMSMRVERISMSAVQERLQRLRQQQLAAQNEALAADALGGVELRLAEAAAADQSRAKERRERRKQKRREKRVSRNRNDKADEEDEEEGDDE